LLATCREARLRNGVRAEELAERAEQLTGGKDPIVLRTVAAAYAEQGRFDAAMRAARQAIELADAQGDSALSKLLREHLDLYRASQPLRER
jgi:Flp pilus assembly protein TadD